MVSTTMLQGSSTNVTTRVWQNPWIIGRVLKLPTEAKIGFWNVGFGIFRSAFGAVPECGGGGSVRGDRKARGGACGGEIGGLAGPALDTDEVENGEAERGTRPCWVGGFDSFEANEA